MRDAILKFPETITIGIEKGKAFHIVKPYRRVVIAGMGGSGTAGKMFSFLHPTTLVHQSYHLPPDVSSQDLVICISWSGMTQETISALRTALDHHIDIVVVTGGGKLAEEAQQYHVPVILLPHESTPARCSGSMLGALIGMFGYEAEFKNITLTSTEQRGQEIAKAVGDRMPIMYAPAYLHPLEEFWKTLINENAKILALASQFPEAAHNEIEGFQRSGQAIVPIILSQPTTHAENRDLKAAFAFFDEIGYTGIAVTISQKTAFGAVLDAYMLGLWMSYSLAQQRSVDPQATARIESFKRLKSELA